LFEEHREIIEKREQDTKSSRGIARKQERESDDLKNDDE
jgi:hypothetical protein